MAKYYKLKNKSNLYPENLVLDQNRYDCLPEDHKKLFSSKPERISLKYEIGVQKTLSDVPGIDLDSI